MKECNLSAIILHVKQIWYTNILIQIFIINVFTGEKSYIIYHNDVQCSLIGSFHTFLFFEILDNLLLDLYKDLYHKQIQISKSQLTKFQNSMNI